MSVIRFKAALVKIGPQTIVRLPENASRSLPSRSMVLVKGMIKDVSFQAPLEPDGKKGHWLNVNEDLLQSAKITAGDSVSLEIEPLNEWPDPDLPDDFGNVLRADAAASDTWSLTTPKARWEYARWINGTKNPETRKRRIDVALSKLRNGKRRPCCFNASDCTDQSVSKGGVLLVPSELIV